METKEVVSTSPLSVTADGDKPAVKVAPVDRIRFVEWLVVPIVLLALIAAQLRFAGGTYLFHRAFWADELHTFWLVDDAELIRSLRALRHGADGGPPVFYLVLRGFCWLSGGANEASFRLYTFLCTIAALLGLYALLRRTGFRALAALTAAFGVWCMYWVHQLAFEARFYAPWLAAISWFCYFLARSHQAPRPWFNNVALAFTAFLVCSTHYFGIVALGLAVAADVAANWRNARWSRATWIALSAGPLAFGLSLPFYFGWRASMSIPTWNAVPSGDEVIGFLRSLFYIEHLAIIPLVLLAYYLVASNAEVLTRGPEPERVRRLAGVTALILMPFCILAITYVAQPCMVERYTIPAALAFGPAIAVAVFRLPSYWQPAVCLGFFCVTVIGLRDDFDRYKKDDARSEAMISSIRQHTGDAPVYFESYHELWVARRYAPDIADRCVFLDFQTGDLKEGDEVAYNTRVFMRDYERNHQKFYHRGKLAEWSELKKQKDFFLVPGYFTADKDAVHLTDDSYPGFTPRPVDARLYAMVARPTETGR